jgi:hypothetical protein
MEVSGQPHDPTALPPGKAPWYLLDRILGGPQSRSRCGIEDKHFQLLQVLEPPIQLVAQRYSVHNNPPLDRTLSQLHPGHTLTLYLIFSLILSSHESPSLPRGSFCLGLPTTILYAFLISPYTCYMSRPFHFPRFYQPNNIWRVVWRSSLFNLLQLPVTSFLSGPNFLLNNLFSKSLNLCSSVRVPDQVPNPYKKNR